MDAGSMKTWTTTASRTFRLILAMALASAMLQAPDPAAAQDTSPPSAAAWWARTGVDDDAARCPAELAWLRAIDVEERDEQQATAEELADVATGPELAREQEKLSTSAPPTERLWVRYSSWRVTGGTSEEVVIYATRVIRAGPADETGNEKLGAERVETVQAAYRMVLENGAWRLADRHIFEQGRHAVDEQLGITVLQQYRMLLESVIQAYNARDADGLQSALDGQALEQYRAELQQLEDQQDDRTVQYSGRLGMIDVEPSGALMDFEGTRAYTGADAQTAEPTTLIHRLEPADGQWKIVDEFEATSHQDADGTEHVEGC